VVGHWTVTERCVAAAAEEEEEELLLGQLQGLVLQVGQDIIRKHKFFRIAE